MYIYTMGLSAVFFYLTWSWRENSLADFDEIWQGGPGPSKAPVINCITLVAQQWLNNLQNKYNTANARVPTAFTGRH